VDNLEQHEGSDVPTAPDGAPCSPESDATLATGAAVNEAATGESDGDEADSLRAGDARLGGASTQPDAVASDESPTAHSRSSAHDVDAPSADSPHPQPALRLTHEGASCEVERLDEELPHSPTRHDHEELIVNRDGTYRPTISNRILYRHLLMMVDVELLVHRHSHGRRAHFRRPRIRRASLESV